MPARKPCTHDHTTPNLSGPGAAARRLAVLVGIAGVALAACTTGATPDADHSTATTSAAGQRPRTAPPQPPTRAPSATPGIDDDYVYPDAMIRRLRRMANEPRPVDNSAMPPRHLDEERFPTTLVDRDRIVSGGVLPDQIPAIDDPVFEPVAEVDWLEADEAVLSLEFRDRARAYPIRVMTWHEIVNDRVADVPVAVTYCPLCNSAVAVDRRSPAGVLDFGTSGALYQSSLVMYDRQTESLWTHFDGRAVVGTLVGIQLARIPVATVSWSQFRDAHPDGQVLTTDTGHRRDYGDNPYQSLDSLDEPLSGWFHGDVDPRLDPMARVVGLGDGAVAVATEDLRREGVVATRVDGRPVTVWHVDGLASSLDAATIAGGRDIGTTSAFFVDRPDDPGEFRRRGNTIIDGTGSTWDLSGRATDGPLEGHTLERVVHLDTFWFAWSTHHPDTRVLPRS